MVVLMVDVVGWWGSGQLAWVASSLVDYVSYILNIKLMQCSLRTALPFRSNDGPLYWNWTRLWDPLIRWRGGEDS